MTALTVENERAILGEFEEGTESIEKLLRN
jgi:hypothetical protein